ncbi:MAG: hypothetical protein R2864_03850 [Syntrophotaleaceae bacterium]
MAQCLFLGCNHNQLPYLLAAQALGFRVVATDLNPQAPGAAVADRFHRAGYDDIEGLVAIAESEDFGADDRIFTASAHFAWEGAAAVAHRLGLAFPSPQVVDVCLDKAKFYPLLEQLGVRVPPTRTVAAEDAPGLDPDKVYYLKSDYGKSPYYCCRVTNGRWPVRPETFDRFYRQSFLLQEEVRGSHYRVNLYGDQAAVFLKFTDTCAAPLAVLGPGHHEVIEALRRVTAELQLTGLLTKFDLIVNQDGWFVIDLGLDPPMRLRLFCEHQGIDFAAAYTRAYLTMDASALPVWSTLVRPLIMCGTPGNITFMPLGDHS